MLTELLLLFSVLYFFLFQLKWSKFQRISVFVQIIRVSLKVKLLQTLSFSFFLSQKLHPPAVQTLSLQRAANQKKAGLIVDKLE